MSFNLVSTWLEAKKSPTILQFSGPVLTTSVFLRGAGGIGGDGFPLPVNGIATKIAVFDGVSTNSSNGSVSLAIGDRVSVYATFNGGVFSVELYINGVSTGLQVGNCTTNTNLFCSILIEQRGV